MGNVAGLRQKIGSQPTVWAVAMLLSVACSETPREPESTSRSTAPVENSGDFGSGEAATEQAIVVRWEDFAPTVRATSLPIQVKNTTAESKTVVLELVGIDPRGRSISRRLGEHSIPALGAMSVTIPLSDLPAQSVRLSSSIVVAAHYQQLQPGILPGEAPQQLSLHASSAIRHVTFDAGFQIATVRTEIDQVRANTAAFAESAPQAPTAGELRVYNSERQGIVEVDPAALTGIEGGVVVATTRQLPPELANPLRGSATR